MQNFKAVVLTEQGTHWAICQVQDDEPYPRECAIRMAMTRLRDTGVEILGVEIDPLERVGDCLAMIKQTEVTEGDRTETKDRVKMWP